MSSPFEAIPREVFLEILAHVRSADSSLQSLSACLLVSRTWQATVAPVLDSFVVLDEEDWYKVIRPWTLLVALGSLRRAEYVRSLTLKDLTLELVAKITPLVARLCQPGYLFDLVLTRTRT